MKARQKILREKTKLRVIRALKAEIHPGAKLRKRKNAVSLQRALCPQRCTDSFPGHLGAALHPVHFWSSSWLFVEVSVRLLFNWRDFLTPVFVNSQGLWETGAVGAYGCRWPELLFSGKSKMLSLLSWLYKLCAPSLCPSFPLQCSFQGRQYTPCMVSEALLCALQLYWTPSHGLCMRKAFLWMHGRHSTALVPTRQAEIPHTPEGNKRTSLSARQEWCLKHWWGPLIVKVTEVLDCLNLRPSAPLMSIAHTLDRGQLYCPKSNPSLTCYLNTVGLLPTSVLLHRREFLSMCSFICPSRWKGDCGLVRAQEHLSSC